jgi:hypothetical protein
MEIAFAMGLRRISSEGRVRRARPFWVRLDMAFQVGGGTKALGVGKGGCVPSVPAATHWTFACRRAKYGILFSGRLEAIFTQRYGGFCKSVVSSYYYAMNIAEDVNDQSRFFHFAGEF